MALGTEHREAFQTQKFQYAATHTVYEPHQRCIAPAPYQRTFATTTLPYTKPTSTIYSSTTMDADNPSVIRRNARERNRVKQVNNGFSNLRQHLPQAVVADLSNGRRGIGPGANKKLSKVDTLRMALEYIRRLQRVIEEVDGSDTSSVSSFTSGSSTNSRSSMSSSSNSSPPPNISASNLDCLQTQRQYFAMSYAGSFQQQQQQPQYLQHSSTMISPSGSTSSAYSSNSESHYATTAYTNSNNATAPLKSEPNYDEYSNTTTEDEDLLDYISLWQANM